MKKRKLYAVLERHLRKYSTSPAVAHRFPTLKDLSPEDFTYFTKHFSMSFLDIEYKEDIEIGDLADYIKNYARVKTLLDSYFEDFFKVDD